MVSLLIQTSRLQALNNSTVMSSSSCFMCPLLPKGALRFTVTHILRGWECAGRIREKTARLEMTGRIDKWENAHLRSVE